ncbi:hypothetical protein FQV08_0003234, partial [Pygoscelis antarcticus]
STYPIFVFSLILDEEPVLGFLLSLSFGLDLTFLPFFSSFPSAETLGKFSGLITRGMFLSPLSFAFAIASDIMRFAFSCLLSESAFFFCFFSDIALTWVFCNLVYDPEPSVFLEEGGCSTRQKKLSLTLPLGLFAEDIFGVRQRLALCFFSTPGSAQEKSIERRLLNGLFSELQPRYARPSTNTHCDLSTYSSLGKYTSADPPA